jgi:hypothetical protein
MNGEAGKFLTAGQKKFQVLQTRFTCSIIYKFGQHFQAFVGQKSGKLPILFHIWEEICFQLFVLFLAKLAVEFL